VGNPHVVFFVDNIEDYDLKKIGPEIENHKYFPEKCNVTLAQVINKKLIRVRGLGARSWSYKSMWNCCMCYCCSSKY
jgi:diaminopimelate epimerase